MMPFLFVAKTMHQQPINISDNIKDNASTQMHGKQVDVLPSKNQALCQLNYCK